MMTFTGESNTVINHIYHYPSMVFVIAAVRQAKETRRRCSVATTSHEKHLFSVASPMKRVTQPLG